MHIIQTKKLYLPALSIVAGVVLLLVLMSISTYRNLDRQKRRTEEFLYRQGAMLIQALEAGARSGMMMPMWQEDSVATLLQETGRNEEIAYLYLFDQNGIIVHHSDSSLNGTKSTWRPQFSEESPNGSGKQLKIRIRALPNGNRVYEMAKRFSPFLASPPSISHHGMMMHAHSHAEDIVVLGLRMTAFDAARQADFNHAIVMAGVLVALGSGTLFFIFVIQNYRLVDRSLKETQDYTRQVVANMANGLLSIDTEGKVASYNLLALNLLGLDEEEIQKLAIETVLDFKTTGIQDTFTSCQSVLDREIEYCKPSGEKVPMALSVTPIINESGDCRAAVVVMRDLSEIKILESKVRRSEKLAAIGKLAAGVAHEIRNPLSSIRGFAQLLSHFLQDHPEERGYAEVMVKEVDRINRVVTDLLTFARPQEAELKPTNFRNVVDHTLRLVQEDVKTRQIALHTNLTHDLGRVPLDENQMTQALLNLLLNALQSLDAGGKVEIGAKLHKNDSVLRIWVEDDGPGIPAEQISKVFDPFFTTREKGTGLGLPIVYKIVENHNGEIRGESPPIGKTTGCRFTIDIPIAP